MAHPATEIEIVSEQDRLLAQLLRIRERLVEKAESLSIKLEANLNPSPAVRLEGAEQRKARHLFVTQAQKIEAELNKLLGLADGFRVHIY